MTTEKTTFELREKLCTLGPENLSDIELLAVFIGSDNKKEACMQLALDIMNYFGDFRAMLTCDFPRFVQVAGLNNAYYTQLQAASEMCRRSDFISLKKNMQLNNSLQTNIYLKRKLRDKKNETFAALFLDNQHRLLAYDELCTGTINTITIHFRPIVEKIIKFNAAALIFAHNHPSGLAKASREDIEITKQLQHALALVDANLLDHLVIGDNEIYSIMNNTKWTCH